ncbi:MAG: hypothetical protein CSB23_02305 [Deltaproteobacteria bacterium]|nr:MAG: hypothetical protein CSB23_02305 [Deltaproteobacteria bacterium]
MATPVENMPLWLQRADLMNPVYYIIKSLRSIFLEGADLPMVWPNLWPLLLIATLTLPSAALMFRKRTL